MTADLFGSPERHSSGCKAVFKLPSGHQGSAEFAGDRDEHRIVLRRWWTDSNGPTPYALWIGMNPSGAEALVNDLTIAKECEWTKRFGLSSYIKMNIGTYRWTQSLTLAAQSGALIHPENLQTIMANCGHASRIILGMGKPPEPLEAETRKLFTFLKMRRFEPMCFGVTKEGWPKHTSRIAYATPLAPFEGMPG